MCTMKFRQLPSIPVCTAALLLYQISFCLSAAPADLPADCPSVSSTQRALLDSCCYSTLLPASSGDTSTWTAVDRDSDSNTWTAEASSEDNCVQSVTICNSTNDWLLTQYINTTLSSGMTASAADINIRCSGGTCPTGLQLRIYSTSTELDPAGRLDDFGSGTTVANGNNQVTGLTMSGFYLALQAEMNACVTINQISIVLTVCSEESIALVTFPESYASGDEVTGVCAANSQQNTGSLSATCESSGSWSTSSSCVCSPGYFLDGNDCTACPTGTYKATAGNETCTNCPSNSEAVSTGSTICTCEANHIRPSSMLATDGCTECVANFFLVGGRCNSCPGNSTSSGGSADHCTCNMNYTTMEGSTTTNSEGCVCGANYHVDSSTGQCVSCPANSTRAITDVVSVCSCNTNYRTASGDMTTSGSVGCIGCVDDYFLNSETCMMCPNNSENVNPVSQSCQCRGDSVTRDQSSTTSDAVCSSCLENWKSTSTSPRTCQRCQDRSVRPLSASIDTCTCIRGYQKGVGANAEICLAVVEIPSSPITLNEGSADNPATLTLNLLAVSYSDLNVKFNVDAEFMDRVTPSNAVTFVEGTRQSTISIMGDNEALSPPSMLEINISADDDYVGNGTLVINIEDDDPVGVGFVATQRVAFNESSEATIRLMKNATTAQDIMLNVIVSPEGASVSVMNPITFQSGPAGSINVPLEILNDVRGGESDELVSLHLDLVSPLEFRHLIVLNEPGAGATDELNIRIIDDDPPPSGENILTLPVIIGIAAGGAGVMILLILIVLVCICICRINANRQGFYFTDEDKATNPPSMLRYSASLRSISSQTVVPIIDGKGQHAEKENEFYV